MRHNLSCLYIPSCVVISTIVLRRDSIVVSTFGLHPNNLGSNPSPGIFGHGSNLEFIQCLASPCCIHVKLVHSATTQPKTMRRNLSIPRIVSSCVCRHRRSTVSMHVHLQFFTLCCQLRPSIIPHSRLTCKREEDEEKVNKSSLFYILLFLCISGGARGAAARAGRLAAYAVGARGKQGLRRGPSQGLSLRYGGRCAGLEHPTPTEIPDVSPTVYTTNCTGHTVPGAQVYTRRARATDQGLRKVTTRHEGGPSPAWGAPRGHAAPHQRTKRRPPRSKNSLIQV